MTLYIGSIAAIGFVLYRYFSLGSARKKGITYEQIDAFLLHLINGRGEQNGE